MWFGFERIPHAVRCDGFVCRRLTSGVSAEVSDGQMHGCLDALAITLRSSPEYSLLDVQKVVGFLKEAGLSLRGGPCFGGSRWNAAGKCSRTAVTLLILHLLSFLLVWLRQNTSQRVKDFWSQSCLELWFQNRVLPGLWRTKAQEEHICGISGSYSMCWMWKCGSPVEPTPFARFDTESELDSRNGAGQPKLQLILF